ncbi:hypothetical protein [Pedobacter roseus]|jgi:hypothetical protein|uniref:Uncharacterized protein n=1 Tax=Pedobacter roseus TaxID=336820 RepID=A0A7G9QMW5_9SPHI|nr:hypothetical protein [Pedobacter roseus]QNN44690.1 hypothetical protein H9L23_11700 [Pedobacter roseus]
MKNRKLMFSLVALIGFGSFFTLNAFKTTTKTVTQYQYLSSSSSEADLHNIANWEEVDSSTPSCGSSGNLVCRYEYNGDINDFNNYISDKSAEFLTDNAVSRKQ